MESKKRTCVVCGDKYNYCPNCSRDAGKPTWMFILCSETCHNVYEILNKRGFKEITDLETKKLLSDLDIKGKKFFPEIQSQIDEVFKVEEPKPKVTEAVETKEKESPTKTTKSFLKKTK